MLLCHCCSWNCYKQLHWWTRGLSHTVHQVKIVCSPVTQILMLIYVSVWSLMPDMTSFVFQVFSEVSVSVTVLAAKASPRSSSFPLGRENSACNSADLWRLGLLSGQGHCQLRDYLNKLNQKITPMAHLWQFLILSEHIPKMSQLAVKTVAKGIEKSHTTATKINHHSHNFPTNYPLVFN